MLKSAWANRNGKTILKEALDTVKEKEQQRLEAIRANKDAFVDAYKKKEGSKEEQFEALFSSLAAGMNLNPIFGINGVVKKVNAKSLVLEGGTKWTKKELRSYF